MTTDNPIKQWIEERRAIHEAATEGPWVAEYSGETGDCVIPHDAQSTREAVAVTRLFHRTADANAIADARNTFPRALDALNAVLELHKPVKHREWMGSVWRDQTGSEWREKTICEECTRLVNDLAEWEHEKTYIEYPCPTVQAIEGAIND